MQSTLTDPSGEAGIFLEGASYNRESNSIISVMATTYEKETGHKAFYFEVNLGDNEKILEEAYDKVVTEWMAQKISGERTEPVDIFGWSRGGVLGYALVQKLAKEAPSGIKVRYLGLIDPTIPLPHMESAKYLAYIVLPEQADRSAKTQLGNNVTNISFIHRTSRGSKPTQMEDLVLYDNYKLIIPIPGDGSNVKESATQFGVNHFRMGFKHKVGIRLWEDAKAAGVNFAENPPAYWDKQKGGPEGSGYVDMPRGGDMAKMTHEVWLKLTTMGGFKDKLLRIELERYSLSHDMEAIRNIP